MAFESSPALIALLAFVAVSGLAFVVGQYLTGEMKIQQRLSAPSATRSQVPRLRERMNAAVTRHFDERRFKLEGPARSKLRLDLIRAGFFHPNAINYYIFWRLAVVVALPVTVYIAAGVLMEEPSASIELLVVGLAAGAAVLGPDAYMSRRRRKQAEEYGWIFPDLLDLMVVCVDAGLGLEAALERISAEMLEKSRALGMNLLLLGSEMRAGRSSMDALASFSERLGLDEARSFSATLRQSIELGTDIGQTLRVFSDEMRDKRLLRAEERANQLPVKMIVPLGTCIFPVVLMVIMLPTVVRLMSVMR